MPLYKFRAVNEDGQAVEDTVHGDSARTVTADLEEQGLQVSSVSLAEKRRPIPLFKRQLSWEDLELFNEQLRSITRSGLPLSSSLVALAADMRNPRLRPILEAIQRDLERGLPLDEALERCDVSFPSTYISAIRAGQRTGNLPGVLSHLSQHSARMIELKNSVQEAAAYPIFVLAAVFGVMTFMLVKVVPEFAKIFEDFSAQLPLLTRFLLDISNVFKAWWEILSVVIVVGLIALYWFLRQIMRTESNGRILDRLKLRVSFLGRMYYAASMGRFCRALSALCASEVPIVEGLALAGAGAGNALLRDAVDEAAEQVEGGERLSTALADTAYFENTFCWLLALGEERGELFETLDSLAQVYERSSGRYSKLLLNALAPVMILITGFFVGLIIMAMYMPIFSLADVMSGV